MPLPLVSQVKLTMETLSVRQDTEKTKPAPEPEPEELLEDKIVMSIDSLDTAVSLDSEGNPELE